MAHIKFVSPHGWDFDAPIVAPIKVSSRGLIGNDRSDFLKRASHSFLSELDNIKFAKDEVPVHLIALGASEAYGPNRNGDGFKEATCRKYHDTFVKFAKFFRNHKNKAEQGDPYYGYVKASAYNEDMKRVELLCGLNAEKSAADRNGGFVADAELEKIARGEDMPVSMACRVPHDICSFCKHAARNRDEYCTKEKCAAGGCRSNLTKLVKVGNDLHHLHVDNPDPTWFDISRVFRPADRIAYGAKADYLTKSASDDKWFVLQDNIKEASSAPLDVILYQNGNHGFWTEKQTALIKLGYALAGLEKYFNSGDANIYRGLQTKPFPIEKLANYGSNNCNTQLSSLADRKIILSMSDFARLTNQEHAVKSAANILPRIYTIMTSDESLPYLVEKGACSFVDSLSNEATRSLAAGLFEDYSLDKSAVEGRVIRSCIQGHSAPAIVFSEKSASVDGEKLAKDYAMYKLAALSRIASTDKSFFVTARWSICQNYVN
jgi:hypothetical protein